MQPQPRKNNNSSFLTVEEFSFFANGIETYLEKATMERKLMRESIERLGLTLASFIVEQKRFNLQIAGKMHAAESRLDSLEERMDLLEGRMDALEKRMDALEKRMDALEKRMDVLEKRMDALEKRMDALEKRIDSIEKNLVTGNTETQKQLLKINALLLTLVENSKK